jgi:integrase
MARLFQRGRWYWIGVRVNRGEDEHRFSLNTKSLEVAERIRSKIETEVSEGRFLDKKRESRWTLGRLEEHYLPRMAQLLPRSAAWRKDRFKRVVERVGKDTLIESIGPETLDRYAEERLRAGRAESTVRADVNVLRHALRQAFRWQAETGLSEYRLRDWKPPKGREARQPTFLTRAEVRRLLEVGAERARQVPEQRRAEVLVRLALETGGRIGELCRITRQDFDEKRATLRLRALKGGVDRSFTLYPDTARDLGALLKASPEPFGGRSAPKDRVRKFWHWVREKAGLSHIRFHDLRHTFASEFLRRGAAHKLLQDQMGHRTSRMTDRYAHTSPRTKAPAGVLWKRPDSGRKNTHRQEPEPQVGGR